jgi:hypothetical protein
MTVDVTEQNIDEMERMFAYVKHCIEVDRRTWGNSQKIAILYDV